MRVTCNYLLLGGLALLLAGCTVPYYAAPPAPVYYAVQPAGIYYPPQRPSISYLPPPPAASSERQQARDAEVPRERQAGTERKQARGDRRHGASEPEGWIDPKPVNGS